MRRGLLTLCSGFCIGFLMHAIIFPDLLTNGIILLPQTPQSLTQEQQRVVPTLEQALVTVTFDGERFSRSNIVVPLSRYLRVVNESENVLMWLRSDLNGFTTPRGYAQGEEVRARMDKKGQFFVINKEDSRERLVITVK